MSRHRGLRVASRLGVVAVLAGASAAWIAPVAATTSDLKVTLGSVTVSPSVVVRSSVPSASATITGAFSDDPTPGDVTYGALTDATGPTCSYREKGTLYTVTTNRSETGTRTIIAYVEKAIDVRSGETVQSHSGTSLAFSAPVDTSGLADGARATVTLAVTARSSQVPRTTQQSGTKYSYLARKSTSDPTLESKCSVEITSWTDVSVTDGAREEGAWTDLSGESAAFTVDLAPPTVGVTFDGADRTAPTGGDMDLGATVRDASPSDTYTVSLAAHFIPAYVDADGDGIPDFDPETGEPTPIPEADRVAEDDPSFGGSISTPRTGTNGIDNLEALSLRIPCAARLGDYVLHATVSALDDLAGLAWDPIDVEVGRFTVINSSELVGTTEIYGYVDTDFDGVPNFTHLEASGFTAVLTPQGKVNTTPGAFYLTNKLKLTSNRGGNQDGVGGDTCNDDVWMNFTSRSNDSTNDMTLEAPAGWAFVKTGQTFAKVFAGDLTSGIFDNSAPTLSGVTATGGGVEAILDKEQILAGTSTAPTSIGIKLGKLRYWKDTNGNGTFGDLGDVQVTGGRLPGDWYVYTWARVRYVGTTAPAANATFTFRGLVAVDGLNDALWRLTKTDQFVLVHAPTQL